VLGVDAGEGRQWYGASGTADTELPLLADDRFCIGSVTKTFTATVILLLMEEGTVALDDTLAQWVPSFPGGDGITVRNLLDHTSGLYDYLADPGLAYDQPWTPEDLAAIAAAHPPEFAPGTDWSYSNTNYLLLGMVAERATGSTWVAEVRSRLLEPLGLEDTYYMGEELPGRPLVRGYRGGEDVTHIAHPSVAWSVGGLVSNARDLNRFTRALFGGDVLEPASLTQMVTPTTPSPPDSYPFDDYGLGVPIRHTPHGSCWGHGGGHPGYEVATAYFPDHDTATALLFNETFVWAEDHEPGMWSLVFGSHVYAIAAAAHLDGAQGTSWVTDVELHRPSRDDAYGELRLLGQVDGTTGEGVGMTVDAYSVHLADVVANTLGEHEAAGAILVTSSQPLLVTSRTFNDAADGTYGQHIPGMPREKWISGPGPVLLLQLTGTDRFRTNIGFANLGPEQLEATVELYDCEATALAILTTTVQPYAHQQLNDVFAAKAPVENGYAVVSAGSDTATYLAYASVVDNASGDPVFIAPVDSADDALWVPAAAHAAGVGGTSWRTDLEVYSSGAAPAAYRIELLEAGEDNSQPQSEAFTLSPGAAVRYHDVLDELFAATGTGAVRVAVDAGEAMVASRTYNDLGTLTYGQLIPGHAVTDALGEGEEARLVGLRHSAEEGRGFRTNIGLANASGEPLEVIVRLWRGDRSYLGARVYELRPYSQVQETDVFRQFTEEDLDDAYATVSSFSPGALYFAYASVVDNRSGDPVYIPAQRTPTE
jgi:D-alanyl-D-alanine carboxypeptidase